jgi:putative CRISPR-associated protein (TIGR02619 family)
LGAELNSLFDAMEQGLLEKDCHVVLLASNTAEGAETAKLLRGVLALHGHDVTVLTVPGLQDADPKRFKTQGLRHLVHLIGEQVQQRGGVACAINATGGYKAQVAMAALLGQALRLPVFYKHEHFDELIAFPPMPVAFDVELALHHAALLAELETDTVPLDDERRRDWDDRLDPLVECETVEGKEYVTLTPVGQVFLEATRGFLRQNASAQLPPPAAPGTKSEPTLTDHSWGNARGRIKKLLERIVEEVPYVVTCRTHYWNLDLPERTAVRRAPKGIELVYMLDGKTVKAWIDTTLSHDDDPRAVAVVADLNLRLAGWLR